MATIGLRDIHYALLADDPLPPGVASYETSRFLRGAISADINPNTSTATLFADDGPADTASTLGEISLELNTADLTPEQQAVLLGHEFSGGILRRRGGDIPPWIAIGFKTLKSNGAYRYIWLAKGKFAVPQETYNTKGDSIEFQTPTISGSFVKRDADDEWMRFSDEDAPTFNPSFSSTWFLSPITIAGAFGQGNYGAVSITISGPAGANGSSVIINASGTVSAGSETATWATNTLTITLANGTTYSRGALQNLITGAAAAQPNRNLVITMTSDLVAATGTSVTIPLAMAT